MELDVEASAVQMHHPQRKYIREIMGRVPRSDMAKRCSV